MKKRKLAKKPAAATEELVDEVDDESGASREKGELATAKATATGSPKKPMVAQQRPSAPRGSRSQAPPTVVYKGARMYTSFGKTSYRVILDSKVNRSDKAFSWSRGRLQAWQAALAYVDAHKK